MSFPTCRGVRLWLSTVLCLFVCGAPHLAAAEPPKDPAQIEAELEAQAGAPEKPEAPAAPAPPTPAPPPEGAPPAEPVAPAPAPAQAPPASTPQTDLQALPTAPVKVAPPPATTLEDSLCDSTCQQRSRARELEAEIDKISLGGPITGMAVGYGAALLMAALSISAAEEDEWEAAIGAAAGAAIGLTVGLVSHVKLSRRRAARRPLQAELAELRLELEGELSEAERAHRERRLAEIDAELMAVRKSYKRYRVGGPIALMAVGFGSTVVLGSFALLAAMFQDDSAAALGIGAGLGAAGGLGGLAWLTRNRRARAPCGKRIKELQRERRSFEKLSLDLRPDRRSAGLSLRFSF